MSGFERQQLTAQNLLSRFGEDVTWTQTTIVENAVKPWEPTDGTSVDYTVKMVFLKKNLMNFKALSYRSKTEIPNGLVWGLMADPGFVPNLSDLVTRSGQALRILSIDKLAPGNEPLLYYIEFNP